MQVKAGLAKIEMLRNLKELVVDRKKHLFSAKDASD